MKVKVVKRSSIKLNPDNPRVIKDYKFKKLIKSVESLPQMLEMRPIIVDENMMILGGNMRYQACVHAGIVEVPIIQYTREEHEKTKTPESYEQTCKEIVIKDNSSFGEWDWDVLANEWNVDSLKEWGLDIPKWEDTSFDSDIEDTGDYDFPVEDIEGSHVKMVQLFMNTQTEPQFKEWELKLRKEYKTDNLTDTVYEVMKKAYTDIYGN